MYPSQFLGTMLRRVPCLPLASWLAEPGFPSKVPPLGVCQDGEVNPVNDATFQNSSHLTRSRLAPNPGPMSLDGTNSYVIAAPDAAGVVVVDPGPLDESHLAALAAAGPVELVLITHRHKDHTEASEVFHELTGAPVRAADPAYCHGGEPLRGGEVIEAGGVEIRVLATPGHTSDSVCFHLPGDGPDGSVLTGDTILGRGTTVLDYPDGRLGITSPASTSSKASVRRRCCPHTAPSCQPSTPCAASTGPTGRCAWTKSVKHSRASAPKPKSKLSPMRCIPTSILPCAGQLKLRWRRNWTICAASRHLFSARIAAAGGRYARTHAYRPVCC
ncbi:beta-lactamase-like protein 2 [Arthrobacter sp. Hiyo8]|nr:beta-lactamase-like protein 2 [Arthrobacter sp. Hiyo8]